MVDEASGNILKPHSHYVKTARRDLLSQAGSAAVGLAAGGGLTAVMLSPDSKKQDPKSKQPQKQAIPTPQSQDFTQKEQSGFEILISSQPSSLRKEFQEQINTQIKFYRDKDPKLVQNIERVRKIVDSEMIQTASRELGIPVDSSLLAIFPGLIFVESKGNPYARAGEPDANGSEQLPYADKRARGLCQLLPATALEEAQKLNTLGFTIKLPPDLYDAKTNILLGLSHLSRLYKLFPEPALAVWAYHFGQGNLIRAIDMYLDHTFPDKKQELEIAWKASPTPTPSLINNKEYDINFMNVVMCPPVQKYFEFDRENLSERKRFLDESEKYAFRVGAGLWFRVPVS